jgi:hypothetical protein
MMAAIAIRRRSTSGPKPAPPRNSRSSGNPTTARRGRTWVRAGETCGVGVRVGSCGVNVANDVAVTLYAANGAPGSATGAIFTRIAQAGPQKVVPDRTSKEGADFLLLWTPTTPGKYTMLAVAQSPDDVSDILGRLPSRSFASAGPSGARCPQARQGGRMRRRTGEGGHYPARAEPDGRRIPREHQQAAAHLAEARMDQPRPRGDHGAHAGALSRIKEER